MTSFIALVPAAGRGRRFDAATPKQWLAVGGRPVIRWTVDRLLECDAREIVVALPAAPDDELELLLTSDPRVRCVVGAATRQGSVARCLAAAGGDPAELVLVHDGVRPAVSRADVAAVLEAAGETGAAILGRPVDDTLKEIAGSAVVRTVDRRRLFRAETPQVFRRELLADALAAAEANGFEGTDESSLVERVGGVEIRVVEATAPNPKLTRPEDLPFLESLLTAGRA